MRPTLNPHLRRLWRDEQTVQFGVESDRALVLAGIDSPTLCWLAELDGRRSSSAAVARAVELGLDATDVRRLLALLTAAAVVVDANETTVEDIDPALHRELHSLALQRGPAHARAVLAHRSRHRVLVHGTGAVADAVVELLRRAGVGPVTGRAGASAASPVQLAVLSRDAGLPDPVLVAGLMRSGTAHLVVAVRETTAVVGPLVLPGRTPCLRCLHLHRCDRDPDWTRLHAQLVATDDRGCGAILAATAAAGAALHATAWLDGLVTGNISSPLAGTVIETPVATGLPRRRVWGLHPGCGCAWEQAPPQGSQPAAEAGADLRAEGAAAS